MKRIAYILGLLLVFASPAHAVLKERNLSRTLSVLRAELQEDYTRQQALFEKYGAQKQQQHQLLVGYMSQCEQAGLMLYSQNLDNTLDMVYACQQTRYLYNTLNSASGNVMQYESTMARMRDEVGRYDALIKTLRKIPPVEGSGKDKKGKNKNKAKKTADDLELNFSDSLLIQAMGSYAEAGVTDSVSRKKSATEMLMQVLNNELNMSAAEPLYLVGQQLEDREECLKYATALRDELSLFLQDMESEHVYYDSAQEKLSQLNEFAHTRFEVIRNEVYKVGNPDYISIMVALPIYWNVFKYEISSRYGSFEQSEADSDWRGESLLYDAVTLVSWIAFAIIAAFLLVRFMPKKWRTAEYDKKRGVLVVLTATVLTALWTMVNLYLFTPDHMQSQALELVGLFTWVVFVVMLSLYLRLTPDQMSVVTRIYYPIIVISVVVVLIRSMLVPNLLFYVIFPPIMIGAAVWQVYESVRIPAETPKIDRIYSRVAAAGFLLSAVLSFVGYSFLAMQIVALILYIFSYLLTVNCISGIAERRKRRKGAARNEWFYVMLEKALLPMLCVFGVMYSVKDSCELFELAPLFDEFVQRDLLSESDTVQFSIYRVYVLTMLWFVFNFMNYGVQELYSHLRVRYTSIPKGYNHTLAKNIIAILVWGVYAYIVLVVLNVPKDGIPLVTAGLATGLGFAMKDLIENFFYGMSLMAGRLKVGDIIECDGIAGRVEKISYQNTTIVTFDGLIVAFLNSELFKKNFMNKTRNHDLERVHIMIGVAYGTDIDKAKAVIAEAVANVTPAPSPAPGAAPDQPLANVGIRDFGDSSVDLEVIAWVKIGVKRGFILASREAIYKALAANDITIPFPQRDLHIIKD